MARTFNNSDHLGASSSPYTAPPFSAGIWINTTFGQARKYITMSVGSSSSNMYSLGQNAVDALGRVAVSSFHGGTNSQNTSSASMTASTWQWNSGAWSGTSPGITEAVRVAGGSKGSGGGVTAPVGALSLFGINGRPGDFTQSIGGGAAHAAMFSRSIADIEDLYLAAGGNCRAINGAAHYYYITAASGTEVDRIGSLDLTVTGTTSFASEPNIATWWTAAALANLSYTQGSAISSIDFTTKFEANTTAGFTTALMQIGSAGTSTSASAAGTATTMLTVASTTGITSGMYVSIAGSAKVLVVYVSGTTLLLATPQTWNASDTVTPFAVAGLTINGLAVTSNVLAGTPGAPAVGTYAGVFVRATNVNNSALTADSAVVTITVASNATQPSFSSGPTLTSTGTGGYTFSATVNQTATVYLLVMKRGSAAPSAAQIIAGSATGSVSGFNASATAATPMTISATGLTFPTHDLYLVTNNGNGSSAVVTFTDQLKTPPAGTSYWRAILPTISAITKANPARVTANGHGLVTGNWADLFGVLGMTQLNDFFGTVTVVDANNFTLDNIDSTTFNTYTSGGSVSWGASIAADASSVVVTGDVFVVDSATTPDGLSISVTPAGAVSILRGLNQARQTFSVECYDVSAGAFMGSNTDYDNDVAPILGGASFVPPPIFLAANTAITPVDLVTGFAVDVQGDTLTVAGNSLTAGLSVVGQTLAGTTPNANSISVATFTYTNQSGDSSSSQRAIVVGNVTVPDVTGLNEPQILQLLGSVYLVPDFGSETNIEKLAISQGTPSGTTVAPNSVVTVQFDVTPPPPDTVVLPQSGSGGGSTKNMTPAQIDEMMAQEQALMNTLRKTYRKVVLGIDDDLVPATPKTLPTPKPSAPSTAPAAPAFLAALKGNGDAGVAALNKLGK